MMLQHCQLSLLFMHNGWLARPRKCCVVHTRNILQYTASCYTAMHLATGALTRHAHFLEYTTTCTLTLHSRLLHCSYLAKRALPHHAQDLKVLWA
jgi:hypothetical protein